MGLDMNSSDKYGKKKQKHSFVIHHSTIMSAYELLYYTVIFLQNNFFSFTQNNYETFSKTTKLQ